MGATIYRIESKSIKGKVYNVRQTATGLRCDCPHFIFNDKEPCKHILEIEKKYRTK